jgi:hypothetical protein
VGAVDPKADIAMHDVHERKERAFEFGGDVLSKANAARFRCNQHPFVRTEARREALATPPICPDLIYDRHRFAGLRV